MADRLSTKQRLFCEYFAFGTETCGNAVRSYALAYGHDLLEKKTYNACKASAHKLLQNEKVQDKIDSLLREQKLTPEFVDHQLGLLVRQNMNLPVKLQAINTYFRIHGTPKEPAEDVGRMLSERALELAKPFLD